MKTKIFVLQKNRLDLKNKKMNTDATTVAELGETPGFDGPGRTYHRRAWTAPGE